ncbi:phytoene/squalene synthase family protein [Spirochaeta lutea]|uniref:phytoene/squalene synthase family protein n=1 Tax=Spirochaeta lutea TaxID=1480694 RepID=UPI00068A5754|nr:phytoene/squalene synthase family protein [Spirochaeta lutea]
MADFPFTPLNFTEEHRSVFQGGSKTYFTSTRFFPQDKQTLVSILYAFVRIADGYVDDTPQDVQGFYDFCRKYREARDRKLPSGNLIIDEFVKLEAQLAFPHVWTEAFLHSMELDITTSSYNSIDETLSYIYGSAEVIGLYMTRIMDLHEGSEHYAKLLGRAMQYINFIRDIDEDNRLGRRYLPLINTSLKSLSREDANKHPDSFINYIRHELDRYFSWQQEAEKGFEYIPKQLRVPIKTASEMYKWTGRQIYRNPFIVFNKKVKPSKLRILVSGLFLALRTS